MPASPVTWLFPIHMLIAVAALLLCGPVAASEPGCVPRAADDSSATANARQIAVIDPVTGAFLDAPAASQLPPPVRSRAVPVTHTLADGTVVADAGDRFRARLVAEVIDGQIVTCHQGGSSHHRGNEGNHPAR